MADASVLLTTLWYTDTTDAHGNPYTPGPEVYKVSFQPKADGQEFKDRELARRIFDHNSWADEQEGRPRVKETLQQVVIMTKPVEQSSWISQQELEEEPEDNWYEDDLNGESLADRYYEELDEQSQLERDISYSKKWADIYDQDKQDLY